MVTINSSNNLRILATETDKGVATEKGLIGKIKLKLGRAVTVKHNGQTLIINKNSLNKWLTRNGQATLVNDKSMSYSDKMMRVLNPNETSHSSTIETASKLVVNDAVKADDSTVYDASAKVENGFETDLDTINEELLKAFKQTDEAYSLEKAKAKTRQYFVDHVIDELEKTAHKKNEDYLTKEAAAEKAYQALLNQPLETPRLVTYINSVSDFINNIPSFLKNVANSKFVTTFNEALSQIEVNNADEIPLTAEEIEESIKNAKAQARNTYKEYQAEFKQRAKIAKESAKEIDAICAKLNINEEYKLRIEKLVAEQNAAERFVEEQQMDITEMNYDNLVAEFEAKVSADLEAKRIALEQQEHANYDSFGNVVAMTMLETVKSVGNWFLTHPWQFTK